MNSRVSSHIRLSSLVRVNTQNVVLQGTLVGKVQVAYRAHMSLDSGVSGDMVMVTRTNHQTFSAGVTPKSRHFLMYQKDVLIQSMFRGIRTRTLRTRKSPAIMFRLHVMPQVTSPVEFGPTLSTRVFTISDKGMNISRGRRKVLALITIVGALSFGAATRTTGGHLPNTQRMPISSLETE